MLSCLLRRASFKDVLGVAHVLCLALHGRHVVAHYPSDQDFRDVWKVRGEFRLVVHGRNFCDAKTVNNSSNTFSGIVLGVATASRRGGGGGGMPEGESGPNNSDEPLSADDDDMMAAFMTDEELPEAGGGDSTWSSSPGEGERDEGGGGGGQQMFHEAGGGG
eukprot:GHVS01006773.1.p1 GENE.GHVS01006773.1~~GHVS01006773.1.p1  ORF type:complete len:162 (+),score=50.33 GHVS01006773.1:313-798(+)